MVYDIQKCTEIFCQNTDCICPCQKSFSSTCAVGTHILVLFQELLFGVFVQQK